MSTSPLSMVRIVIFLMKCSIPAMYTLIVYKFPEHVNNLDVEIYTGVCNLDE